MRKSLKICFGLCLAGIIVCFFKTSYAEEGKRKEPVVKEITGELSFVDKNFISVVYKKENDESKEYEMMFYISQDIMLENIRDKDLKKLNEQDVVEVEYTEIGEQIWSKRTAKRVRLIKKKTPPLNLKGFKK